jgi:hypothetical protein
MEGEFGTFAWGTVGNYVARNAMLSFVEHLGHKYDPLVNNSDPELNEQADPQLLTAAITAQILSSNGESDEDFDEEGEDDNEE